MALMSIPPELRLSIAEYLDPISSFNFALTCKNHCELCQPAIKAHKLGFAEPQIIEPKNAQTEIWQTLRDVRRDPSRGWYITEISLVSSWEQDYRTPAKTTEFQDPDTKQKLMELYDPPGSEGLIRTKPLSGYWNDLSKSCLVTEILKSIEHGDSPGCMALLIHYLPNLKTLRMTGGSENHIFEQLLHRVGVEYQNPAKAGRLPLRRLKTVSLSHHDTEGCISPDWILPFMYMPSVRTFAANMMGGNFRCRGNSKGPMVDPHLQSNIEELLFSSCQFDSRALDYILSGTHSLKRFTYTGGGACLDGNAYEPKTVIKSLGKYAPHSLEHLWLEQDELLDEERSYRDDPDSRFENGEGSEDMDDEDDSEDDNEDDIKEDNMPAFDRPATADLRCFTKLRGLSATWMMLWPEVYEQPHTYDTEDYLDPSDVLSQTAFDVRTVLPPSLEMLYVEGQFNAWYWNTLVEPFTRLSEQTPLLTKDRIRIDGNLHGSQTGEILGELDEPSPYGLPGERRKFGNAERSWFEGAEPPMRLFDGHGW